MDGFRTVSIHKNAFNYTLYGALFGFCFPVFSVAFDIYVQQLDFSVASIFLVQATQPLHWVINTAPFFLGLFACLAGMRQDRIGRINFDLEKRLIELKALRQIREEVWKMKSAADIEHVSEVLKISLDILKIPYAYCGINVVDLSFEAPMVQYHNAAKKGEWMIVGKLEEDDMVLQCWQAGVPAYRPDLEAEDIYQEREQLCESYDFPIRSVLDIPFSHGTLAVNSSETNAFSQYHIELLKEVAQVLSEGFLRMEDLRTLEQHNRDLEDLLDRFKKTNEELEASNQMLQDRSEHISQLNGLLTAIRSINRLIVAEKDRQQLIDQSCKYLLESHNFTHAWIVLFKDGGRDVYFAESGVGEGFARPLVRGLFQREGYPCVKEALKGEGAVPILQPEFCNCPLSNCISGTTGCVSGRAGCAATLVHEDEVFGVLSVAVANKETLDDEIELGLLEEVAGDIAFALHNIEAALQRERTEKELEKARETHTQTLEEMLQQKEMLLKEVHHRVKNNMQVMMSLIRMQIRRADEAARIPLEDALGRLRAMTHALEWLHVGSDLGTLDLGQYLGRLTTDLQSFFPEGVELLTSRVQLGVNTEQVVPIGLIVNELVTNALQHAFPDGEQGSVRVDLLQGTGEELVVEVADDGVGLPPDKKVENGGIGMKLVTSLAAQMGGRLEVERLERGTRVRVICPSVLSTT